MRYPSLRSARAKLLRHATAIAGVLVLAAAQAQDGSPRKGVIRAGCGTLSDSQGRAVAQQSDTAREVSRPAHCPEVAAAPAVTSPPPEPVVVAPAPVDDSRPVETHTSPRARTPVRPRPKPVASPSLPPPSPVQVTATAPAPARLARLESNRTTYAFGETPELRLDPVGAGLALVTSGGLLWFLRSGFAVSLLLLGLPVWRDVDLLPVIAGGVPDAMSEDDPDAEAGTLLTAGNYDPLPPERSA